MKNTQKIIFLDIDGPVINTPCFFIDKNCSKNRSFMNTQAIGFLSKIAELSSAKIVTNSTHNFYIPKNDGKSLKEDLIDWGLRSKYFHRVWRTDFARVFDDEFDEMSKQDAIDEWLRKNGSCDWISIDDEKIMENDRLFLANFKLGINFQMFNDICRYWRINKDDLF